MSLFAKALMPIASSFFRKTAPMGIGGVRSFFSKAPSLSAVSSGLGKVARIGNQVLDSPVADALASRIGGGDKGLALARRGLKGVESAQKGVDTAQNLLEKVKRPSRPIPTPEEVGLPMPPSRMPVAFDMNRRGY